MPRSVEGLFATISLQTKIKVLSFTYVKDMTGLKIKK